MKSILKPMMIGSAAYNLFQLFTVGGERYSYAAGLLIMLLLVSQMLDSVTSNKEKSNENVQTDDSNS